MESINSTLISKNNNFSIICNNCLGGFICQYYNIEYKTPTLGLFMLARDYIKFLSDIKFYLSKKLEFINIQESMYYKHYKKNEEKINFPIARLHDIEIYFMHYRNSEEVTEKWSRRISKINWNNLIIIMAENETCTYEVIKAFDMLPFRKKICFTRNEYLDIKSSVYIKEMKEDRSFWSIDVIMKNFDLKQFIYSEDICK